jgi:type I restriction enzyme S subunit
VSGELPNGWVNCKLEDCIEILDSVRKPVNNNQRQARIANKDDAELYPYYGATGQVGFIDGYLFDGEYIALGEDGVPFFDPLKHKAYLLNGKTWVNNHAHVIKGEAGIDNRYLCYLLNQTDYQGYVNGATRLKLTQVNMKRLPLALAPLSEQIRIANNLDSLLAKVDAAQTRLEKIPSLLKRFRQSVLTAATSGELTSEWRKGVNSSNWNTKLLQDVANIIDPQPSHRTPPEVSGGIPYIGIGDLNEDGSIDFERARKVSIEVLEEHKNRYNLKRGDFIFGKIGTLGKPTVLPTDKEFTLSANVILIQPNNDLVDASYLNYFLSSPETMASVANQATSTSQAAFGIKKMRSFSFEMPPKEEQAEIVRRVESLFGLADNIEKQYTEAKKRTDRLTQSLLAKAFRGELVPQDPNDEPASELLKRIQAERKQLTESKPKRKATINRTDNNAIKSKGKNLTMKLSDAPENYLLDQLKQLGGEADAKVLWNRTELDIDDFYAKLKQEMLAGSIIDDKTSSDPSQRKLKVLGLDNN